MNPLSLQTGLTVHNGKFLYGWKHGFGYRWLPDRIQRLIVNTWNPIGCRLYGHSWFGSECVDCLKKTYDRRHGS